MLSTLHACLVSSASSLARSQSGSVQRTRAASIGDRLSTRPRSSFASLPGRSTPKARLTALQVVAEATTDTFTSPSASTSETTSELLKLCAGLDRGQIATTDQKAQITELISRLEASDAFTASSLPKVNGTWNLVFTTAEIFCSSPFFWTFQKVVGPASPYIFQFTDRLPARKGKATQEIDLAKGTFVSKVDLSVAPGLGLLDGTVVTSCRVRSDPSSTQLKVVVETTAVEKSWLAADFLNGFKFPSEQALELHKQFWNGQKETVEVPLDVTFCNDQLRISRTEDGNTFVYVRRT